MAIVTRKLLDPITVKMVAAGGETRDQVIEQFDFDFPDDGVLRAKHLRATDGHSGVAGMSLALIAHFSGQPMKVVDELSERDFVALYEVVEGFRTPGGQTGD